MTEATDTSLGTQPAARETVWCSFMSPAVIAALGVEGLLQAGSVVRFGPKAMLSNLLGGLAPLGLSWLVSKGLPYGISRLFGHIPGRLFALITDGIFALTWAALHLVRVHGRPLADWAKYWATNQFDNLFAGPGKHGWECPMPRLYTPHPTARLPERGLPDQPPISGRYDVTPRYHELLDTFRPVEIQREDDQPPISLECLLAHGAVRVDGAVRLDHPVSNAMGQYREVLEQVDSDAASKHVDTVRIWVDDDFARGRAPRAEYGAATVYARVLWDSGAPNTLRLFYGHVRAGSYLPTQHLYDLSFEHDGDGEFVTVVVSLEPRGADVVATLRGVEFGAHKQTLDCSASVSPDGSMGPLPLNVRTDGADAGRPVIHIGYGSHALSPQGGRQPGTFGSTDWYPEEDADAPPLSYTLAKNLTHDTNELVFTERAMWGRYDGSYPGYAHVPFHPSYAPARGGE